MVSAPEANAPTNRPSEEQGPDKEKTLLEVRSEKNGRTPPTKRTKKNSKQKAKKAKYDESPLSQSPKASAASLWSSSAILDGAGLLDLSSDEEDTNTTNIGTRTDTILAQQAKQPVPAAKAREGTTATEFVDPNPADNIFGSGASSIFQASSVLGMDLVDFSEDDDD